MINKLILRRFYNSGFVRNVFQTASTRIILIPISLITSVIIAKAVGPEGRGVYAICLTIGALGIQFGNIGLHTSNTFHVSRSPDLFPYLFGNSIFISFFWGFSISGLAWAFFTFFPQLVPVQGILLFLGLIWIPIGLAYLLLQNLLLATQDIGSYNKIEVSTKLITLALIGGCVYFSDEISVKLIIIISLATLLSGLIWAFWTILHKRQTSLLLSYPIFKKGLPLGIKSYIGSFMGYLLIRIDLLMINDFLGEKDAGLYDIAMNASEMVFLLSYVVGMILFPKLSALNDINEKWRLTKEVCFWLTIIMAGLSCVGVLFAKPIILFLYGIAFEGCTPALILLILGKPLLAINLLLNLFVASIHVPLSAIPMGILSVVINIFLNLQLIDLYGIEGAAISSIICFALLTIFHFYYARKYLRNGYPAQA